VFKDVSDFYVLNADSDRQADALVAPQQMLLLQRAFCRCVNLMSCCSATTDATAVIIDVVITIIIVISVIICSNSVTSICSGQRVQR